MFPGPRNLLGVPTCPPELLHIIESLFDLSSNTHSRSTSLPLSCHYADCIKAWVERASELKILLNSEFCLSSPSIRLQNIVTQSLEGQKDDNVRFCARRER